MRLFWPRLQLFAVVSLVLASSAWAADDEKIHNFDSDIAVQRDGTVLVTERLGVDVSGSLIRHGVYRNIAGTGDHRPNLKVEIVRRDGRDEPYAVEHSSGGEKLIIGNAAAELEPGWHSYEIRYRVQGLPIHDGDVDRLYWNVTGNQWPFPIQSATAQVSVPTSDRAEAVAYTGPYGSKGTDYSTQQLGPGKFLFSTSKELPPGSGFTIDVEWPHSISAPLWQGYANLPNVSEFGQLALALAIVLGCWFFSWMRDPQHVHVPTQGVLSSPPRNLSPAALRYAREQYLDNKTFTSAVVDLASRGVIHIDEAPDDYRLTSIHAHRADLPVEERALLNAVFGASHSVELKRDSRRIMRALRSFAAAMDEEYKAFVSTAPAMTLVGWIISGFVVSWTYISLGTAGASTLETLILLAILLACVALLRITLQTFRRTRPLGDFVSRVGLLTPVAMALLTALILFGLSEYMPSWWITLVGLHILVNLSGEHWLRISTGEGAQIAAEAEEFRRFLLQDAKGQILTTTFTRWAGYALALDLEDEWLAALNHDVDQTVSTRPQWYHGEKFEDFYLRSKSFERGLLYANARSYTHGLAGGRGYVGGGGGSGGGGSSGGGFSGGGMGGGGGGGW